MRNRCLLPFACTLLLLNLPSMASAACVERVFNCVVPGGEVLEACTSSDESVGVPVHATCRRPRAGQFVGVRCANGENQCCGCYPTWPPNPVACDIQLIDSATVQIFAQSALGLTSITPVTTVNVNLSTFGFSPGTTEAVQVIASKVDTSRSARIELQVCDVQQCITCDPVTTLVIRQTGKPAGESFADLPQAESNVTVFNGRPGLRNLRVVVNGETFRLNGLEDGEERTLDVASAMLPGSVNSVTLLATGKPGGQATVVIQD